LGLQFLNITVNFYTFYKMQPKHKKTRTILYTQGPLGLSQSYRHVPNSHKTPQKEINRHRCALRQQGRRGSPDSDEVGPKRAGGKAERGEGLTIVRLPVLGWTGTAAGEGLGGARPWRSLGVSLRRACRCFRPATYYGEYPK
jgi:hypothetical protein